MTIREPLNSGIDTIDPTPITLSPMAMGKTTTTRETAVDAVGVRSYISEPNRGRRSWTKNPEAREAVYRDRRRIRGERSQRLLRLRGERLERPFAHLDETGGMRRVFLRGHTNIRKRLLIHVGGLNLGLLMRRMIGVGTPRGLQGRLSAALVALLVLIRAFWRLHAPHWPRDWVSSVLERVSIARYRLAHVRPRETV